MPAGRWWTPCPRCQAYTSFPSQIPEQFSFTAEVVVAYKTEEGSTAMDQHVVIPRSEWFFPEHQVSRQDFKPITGDNSGDPFNGKNGLVSQINDFNTGLAYIINKDMGNCTVSTIEENAMGDSIIQDGRIHMLSPFALITSGAKFALNGMVKAMEPWTHGPMDPWTTPRWWSGGWSRTRTSTPAPSLPPPGRTSPQASTSPAPHMR